MDRRAALTIFLIVFTTVYAGMQYYILGRLLTWAGLTLGTGYIITAAILALSFPVAELLEQRSGTRTTNLFYDASVVWMGTVMILLLGVLAGELLVLAGLPARIVAILVACSGLILSGWALLRARTPFVREFTIPAAVEAPLTLAVATDVHAGPVHGKRYLSHIVSRIAAHGADMLLLPGDLLDGPGRLPDDVLAPLDDLGIPIYHSWGNHEGYVGEEEVSRVMEHAPIRSLRNEAVEHDGVTIIGIDDSEERNRLREALPGVAHQGYTILLYHRPDGLEDAAANDVDLMLSGHTHRGQIFPFTLLVKLRFPRMHGWYEHGGCKLYVSSGAGTWGPPMRLGSRSEIIFITLVPEP